MKQLLYFGIFVLGVAILSCEKPPELPATPSITFESVRFAPGINGFDSLIITIGFQDGDGDMGLLGSEDNPPYNEFNFPRNSQGEFILYGDPEAPDAYNVCDFLADTLDVTGDGILDTVYVELNPNHYNIEVDYFVKQDGEYEEFDWRREFGPFTCLNFDGRYPPLNTAEFQRPLAGSLSYAMTSSGFLPLFGNDTLQLRVQIKDRALNISNTVESQDFIIGQ